MNCAGCKRKGKSEKIQTEHNGRSQVVFQALYIINTVKLPEDFFLGRDSTNWAYYAGKRLGD
jgi:hypothetical protein